MPYASAVHMVRDFLEGPLTRSALARWRRRQFLSQEGFGSYHGVFDSFAEARESLPRTTGFNEEAVTADFTEICGKIFAFDYPMLWWLSTAFRNGAQSVLDIGGSVGVHYYAYRTRIDMPETLSWNIVELPAAASVGRRLAAERRATAIEYSQELWASISRTDADIWHSAGALQYIEEARPAQLLQRCSKRPAHILLNKLPIYEGEDFVTTQNIGHGCFAPVHVFNRSYFIGGIRAQGYALRDEWAVHERALILPDHPERSLQCFAGLYFCQRGQ